MSDKHTPGPWRVVESGTTRDIRSCEGAPRTIAVLYRPFPHLIDEQENEANARLIAAAPDLLAALEECLNYIEAKHAVEGMLLTPKEFDWNVQNAKGRLSYVKISANAAHHGVRANLDQARAAVSKARGE